MKTIRAVRFAIIIILCVFSVIWGFMVLISQTNRPHIKEKTHDKYLRNLDKFQIEFAIDSEPYLFASLPYRDSIKSIFFTWNYEIDPFTKYSIMDVGGIPRSSKLSKAIDSVLHGITQAPNPYE